MHFALEPLCLIFFRIFRYSDLIVAAPFYYGKKEGGAVYVFTRIAYCKGAGSRETDKCKPTKLVGREESRYVAYFEC